jgi:curved DNA-binding protein CbpA
MKNYYRILEIPEDATQDQIRAQYRFLVQAWHPDKFGATESKVKAEERLKEINEAYSVLKDPAKRSEYDRARIFSKSVAGSQPNNYSSDTTNHESEENTERENQPKESEFQRDYPKPSRKPQNKTTIGKTQTAVLLTSIFGIFLILFFVLVGVAWTVWGQSTPTAITIATQSNTRRIDRTPGLWPF